MSISPEVVKQLRERTGAGVMECKRALVETKGDLDAAAELMRKQGLAKADRKAARIAAEGVIVIERSADGRTAAPSGSGFFLGPTLFDRVTPEMRIYKEEIFGPVLSVVRAKDYEEAVRLPSEHEYGNGVAIFTRDGDAARDFVNRVEVGMVGVNFAIPVPLSYYTFGGWKRSGFGDLNQHGPDSIRFYTRTKTVTARWPSGVKEGAEFVIPTMK